MFQCQTYVILKVQWQNDTEMSIRNNSKLCSCISYSLMINKICVNILFNVNPGI